MVSANLSDCLARARDRSEHGYGYPRFVRREFEKFLDCGVLARGFLRVRCPSCPDEKLVAFSCKTRGICPSCTSRRMADTAARLVDHVLPDVPYRQWVVSFPKRVRFLLAKDASLLSEVLGTCLRKIFAWQRRRARDRGLIDPQCGAITFVQRFGSLLNLNCHFHSVMPDGVFVPVPGGGAVFRHTQPPSDEDVERLVQQIAKATEKRIAGYLARRSSDELGALSREHNQEESPSYAFPKGTPRLSRRRCAFYFGYSLHAERFIQSDDRTGLERLCRYGARAAVANKRLSVDDDGNAVIELRHPLHDGRTHLTFSPIEFVRRLATLVPPPHKNLTRYHGVFAPRHPFRTSVVRAVQAAEPTPECTSGSIRPSWRLSWAELLKRVFAIDVLVCEQCGGPMQIIAAITDDPVSEKILAHLARPPPAV